MSLKHIAFYILCGIVLALAAIGLLVLIAYLDAQQAGATSLCMALFTVTEECLRSIYG